MKECRNCGGIKTLEEFPFRKISPDGRGLRCKICNNEAAKLYREKHKDIINAKQNKYRSEHRDEINRIERIKRQNNPERKKINRKATNKAREPKRAFVAEYFSKNPCAHCGDTRIACLQFDHLHDKAANIARLVGANCNNMERLKEEISKCQVLCANCHAIKTAHQFNHWRVQEKYQPNLGFDQGLGI